MSMSDPIAAMLTIIRNGQMVNKAFVCTDMSSKKESILSVLKDEGFIQDYEVKEIENNKKRLKIKLKYFQNHNFQFCGGQDRFLALEIGLHYLRQ